MEPCLLFGLQWQVRRDTALAGARRVGNPNPVARWKAPSPLCSADAVQKASWRTRLATTHPPHPVQARWSCSARSTPRIVS